MGGFFPILTENNASYTCTSISMQTYAMTRKQDLCLIQIPAYSVRLFPTLLETFFFIKINFQTN